MSNDKLLPPEGDENEKTLLQRLLGMVQQLMERIKRLEEKLRVAENRLSELEERVVAMEVQFKQRLAGLEGNLNDMQQEVKEELEELRTMVNRDLLDTNSNEDVKDANDELIN